MDDFATAWGSTHTSVNFDVRGFQPWVRIKIDVSYSLSVLATEDYVALSYIYVNYMDSYSPLHFIDVTEELYLNHAGYDTSSNTTSFIVEVPRGTNGTINIGTYGVANAGTGIDVTGMGYALADVSVRVATI
jgi:hypothetical protein